MKELTIAEIKKEFLRLKKSCNDHVRIAVLRNSTIEPLEDYLKYCCAKEKISAQVKFSTFDAIYQDVLSDKNAVVQPDTDVVIIALKLENISRDLSRRFCALRTRKISEEKNYIVNFIETVCRAIRTKSNALILCNLFEYPLYPAYGILDSQAKYQMSAITELNSAVKSLREQIKSLYFIDTNVILNRIGAAQMYDNRYWHMAQAPYGNQALYQIALETFKFIRALKGKNKKCLILDCDNTLWGGVIGEDGIKNIKLGREYPGSCYYELQEEILNLYHRGVLLALNSKNDERDVWQVFAQHPQMVLRKQYLAASRINWLAKHENIKSIANELNIALESVVFLDDSPFECGLVRKFLPQVTVVELPAQATEYRDILASSGVFDSYSLSKEDRSRTKMYRQEKSRSRHAQKFSTIADYLKSLKIELTLTPVDSGAVARIAQLTQRTNQFNLTAKRYSDSQIEAMLGTKDTGVWQVSYKDRFGDAGVVGAAIVNCQRDKALVDTFLLSCRVLGRGVEDALLYQCARTAQQKKCKTLIIPYKKTEKNSVGKDFLDRLRIHCKKASAGISEFSCVPQAIKLPGYFYKINFCRD